MHSQECCLNKAKLGMSFIRNFGKVKAETNKWDTIYVKLIIPKMQFQQRCNVKNYHKTATSHMKWFLTPWKVITSNYAMHYITFSLT